MAIQKKISDKEFKLSAAKEINNEKLNRYTARQEYIRLQIAKIEAEIEEIAKQDAEIWAQYKAAKAEAKRQKAEYKAQVKKEKEAFYNTYLKNGFLIKPVVKDGVLCFQISLNTK